MASIRRSPSPPSPLNEDIFHSPDQHAATELDLLEDFPHRRREDDQRPMLSAERVSSLTSSDRGQGQPRANSEMDVDAALQGKPPLRHSGRAELLNFRGTSHEMPIIIAVFMTTVPLLLVVGVLIYLIFSHQVVQTGFVEAGLQLPSDVEDSEAYFVDFSATQLTTLASWASNIASLLPSFLMTLFSYYLARAFLRQSGTAEWNRLPSPYQLGLLLETIDGKFMSLWNTTTYAFWKRRSKMNVLLHLAFILLLVAFILSALIWAADTWLHVTVSTVFFSQISRTSSSPSEFGFRLPDACVNVFKNADMNNATIIPGFADPYGINSCLDTYSESSGASDGYLIMNNVSSSHQVITSTKNGSDFSFLAPAFNPPGLEFSTSTVGVSSSCQLISQRCNLRYGSSTSRANVLFNCSTNFNGAYFSGGKVAGTSVYSQYCSDNTSGCLAFFSDISLSTALNQQVGYPYSLNTSTDRYANPFYAGVVGNALVSNDWADQDSQFLDLDGYWYILECDLTVYNVTYSWVNGTMMSNDLALASDDTATMVRFGLLKNEAPSLALPSMSNAVQLTMAQSNSSGQLESSYARTLERVLLSFSAKAWTPVTNTEEQFRNNLLVARVPKAPLFVLISLCLMWVILGVLVTVVALASQSKVTRDVQARLSVYGIIASRFERPEVSEASVKHSRDIFEEREGGIQSTNVGIVRSNQGGWRYSSSAEERPST